MNHRTRLVRRAAFLVATLPFMAIGAPAVAEDVTVPESCKLHRQHVVNPGCVPALTDEWRNPGITLPNLVPDTREVTIAYTNVHLDPETGEAVWTEPYLEFDTYSQNLGSASLDVTFDRDALPEMRVLQCVSWSYDRICRERRPVGGFEYHDVHGHFHFLEFATYELRRLRADGSVDQSAAGLIAGSPKVSFCLIDSAPVTSDAFMFPTYTQCTPARQGISPGWADIYTSNLEGQSFPIDGITDGRYALVLTLDPNNRLYETDDSDNRVAAILEISGGVKDVAVVERRR